MQKAWIWGEISQKSRQGTCDLADKIIHSAYEKMRLLPESSKEHASPRARQRMAPD
jgi:hypothetical protein